MATRIRRRAGLAGLALSTLLTGCGVVASATTPPKAVPTGLAPASLKLPAQAAAISVQLYPAATRRFATAGGNSMVADGRLWQLRQGPTLVGTLEIATFKPKVNLRDYSERQQLISLIMPGAFLTTQVGRVQVFTTSTPNLDLYLWFGRQLFEVMQVRTSGVDAKAVLQAVIDYQQPSGQLLPVSVTSGRTG